MLINKSHTPVLRFMTISFDLPIHPAQIPLWRGAFIEMVGREYDLFHNHINVPQADSRQPVYHYRYPLIQYRMLHGNAAIFAINEGVEVLQEVLTQKDWQINWQGQTLDLNVEDLQMNEHALRMLSSPKAYRLQKWLALNQKNYIAWQQCDGLIEKVALLERILATNLLMTCNSFHWRLPERLTVRITNIHREQWVRCHGDRVLAFSLTFKTNVSLPAQLATGKSVSLGFGWIEQERILNKNKFQNTRKIQNLQS